VDEDDAVGAGEAASVLATTAGRSGSDLSVVLSQNECFLDDNDVTQGFMFTQEEYDRMKYESPLVKKLRELEVRILFDFLVIVEDGTRDRATPCYPY
jgi:hypothetical protein